VPAAESLDRRTEQVGCHWFGENLLPLMLAHQDRRVSGQHDKRHTPAFECILDRFAIAIGQNEVNDGYVLAWPSDKGPQ
jgi:hypothetical protein